MKLTVTVLSECGTEQETRNMILVFMFCFVLFPRKIKIKHGIIKLEIL